MVSSIPTAATYILSIFLIVQSQVSCVTWTVQWEHKNIAECEHSINGVCPLELHMEEKAVVNVTIDNLDGPANQTIRLVSVSDSDVLDVRNEIPMHKVGDKTWRGSYVADATFIGKASVYVEVGEGSRAEKSENELLVIITRAKRVIDTVFVASVATLVSILYINFGAALDLRKVKGVLRRPIGPVIAFACHFVLLPLVSCHFILRHFVFYE